MVKEVPKKVELDQRDRLTAHEGENDIGRHYGREVRAETFTYRDRQRADYGG